MKEYNLNIANQNYSILSDETTDILNEKSEILNQNFDFLNKKYNHKLSKETILILMLLNNNINENIFQKNKITEHSELTSRMLNEINIFLKNNCAF